MKLKILLFFEDMIYIYLVLLLPENLRLYGLGIFAVIFYLHHGYQGKKTALLPIHRRIYD